MNRDRLSNFACEMDFSKSKTIDMLLNAYGEKAMKTYLRGTHFDDTHELSAAVQVAISNIQPSSFRRCFIQSWLERCRKCISFNGEYFEKD